MHANWEPVKSNNIVYYKKGNSEEFIPYDPEIRRRSMSLYVKDKEGNFHDLGVETEKVKKYAVSIACSSKFYWTKPNLVRNQLYEKY